MTKTKKPRFTQIDENLINLPLPNEFESLIRYFTAIDTVCCFLARNQMRCTTSNVDSLMKQLFSNEQGLYLDLCKLQILQDLCPQSIQLQHIPARSTSSADSNETYDVEIIFPLVSGASTANSTRRKKLLRQSMVNYLQQKHESFLRTLGTLEGSQGSVTKPWDYKSKKWHKDFPVESVLLPAPVNLPPKPESSYCVPLQHATDPFVAPPAPLVMPGYTGVASPIRKKRDGVSDNNTSSCNVTLAQEPDPADPLESIGGVEGILTYLKSLPFYSDQITHIEQFPAREAEYGQLLTSLPPALEHALFHQGKRLKSLYLHQTRGIDAVCAGYHLSVSTGTSSGKSLMYNIPVLREILLNPTTCALYIFPTKALAQDQLRAVVDIIEPQMTASVRVGVCDGDTHRHDREICKHEANIILTNPDMLHVTILPQFKQWSRLFENLKYVVVDEAHTYRGIFGAHVSGVMRRLVRICAHYGRIPQFICCSATISNPEGHFQEFLPLNCIGGPERLFCVTSDTAPRGRKWFVMWNPPLKTNCSQELSNGADDSKNVQHKQIRPQRGKAARRNLFRRRGNEACPAPNSSESCGASAVVGNYHNSKSSDQLTTSVDDPLSRFLRMCDGHVDQVVENKLEDTAKVITADPSSVEDASQSAFRPSDNEPVMHQGRRSTIVEASLLFSALIKRRIRTLAFCKVRKLVEMVLRYTLQDLGASAPHLCSSVSSYRGGYTKSDRRNIESKLFNRKLVGVTATCALEVGVDIGQCDATLHLGFPGSISSLWQQAGRAGRSGRDSVSICVMFDGVIDQWMAKHGEDVFRRPVEECVCMWKNESVLRVQLLCASKELPLNNDFHASDTSFNDTDLWGGKAYEDALRFLLENRELKIVGSEFSRAANFGFGYELYRCYPGRESPSREYGLRFVDPVTFEVVDDTKEGVVIDHVGYSRAFYELFEGAIYLHQARQYLITKLDMKDHKAHARPVKVGYFTIALNHTYVDTNRRLESGSAGLVHTGYAHICAHVWGYRKIWLQTGKIFESGEFSLPSLEYDTRAFWIDIPPNTLHNLELKAIDFVASVHALNHALLAVVPAFILCDALDVDTEHLFPRQQRPRPAHICIYDKRPGGVGISESIFSHADAVLQAVAQLLRECECERGCPACVHNHSCTDFNVVLDKRGALVLIESVIDYRARFTSALAADSECTRSVPEPTLSLVPRPLLSGPSIAQRTIKHAETPPRKRRCLQTMRVAKAMDNARKDGLRVRKEWTKVLPGFVTDT